MRIDTENRRNNGHVGNYYPDKGAKCWKHSYMDAKYKIWRGDEIIHYCDLGSPYDWECLPECIDKETCWHSIEHCMVCGVSLWHLDDNGFNRCWHYIHIMCNICDKKRKENGECPKYAWEEKGWKGFL